MTATNLSTGRLLALIDVARHAPSILNTQPWQFRVADGAVRLYADWGRQPASLDPDGRELILSSGAALAVLRLAACHEGLEDHVESFPDLGDPHLLAGVTLDAATPPEDDRPLSDVARADDAPRGAP